jgi:hypothetical protein
MILWDSGETRAKERGNSLNLLLLVLFVLAGTQGLNNFQLLRFL